MCHGQCCESECEDLQTKTDTTVYNKKWTRRNKYTRERRMVIVRSDEFTSQWRELSKEVDVMLDI
jgi:hypothetical protein